VEGAFFFCTPTAETFEGLRKSGDGRDNPNKLSWQVHEFVEKYRSRIEGEVLNPYFSEWLMGFPVGWVSFSREDFSLIKGYR